MGKFCQLVIGPAGSGKSTYCQTIQQHCETVGRSIHVVNLDPAAEHFGYTCAVGMLSIFFKSSTCYRESGKSDIWLSKLCWAICSYTSVMLSLGEIVIYCVYIYYCSITRQ